MSAFSSWQPSPELKKILEIVVGEEWPEADEQKLYDLAAAWAVAASALESVAGDVGAVTDSTLQAWSGGSAAQFETFMRANVGPGLADLARRSKLLRQTAQQAAEQVEYAKWMIVASAIQLMVELAILASTLFGLWLAPARITLARIFSRAMLNWLLRALAYGIGTQLAMDAGVQGLQMLFSKRENWDVEATKMAATTGVIMAPAGVLSKVAGDVVVGRFLPKLFDDALGASMARVAAQKATIIAKYGAEGALAGAITAGALTGITGEFDWRVITEGLFGAAPGAHAHAPGAANPLTGTMPGPGKLFGEANSKPGTTAGLDTVTTFSDTGSFSSTLSEDRIPLLSAAAPMGSSSPTTTTTGAGSTSTTTPTGSTQGTDRAGSATPATTAAAIDADAIGKAGSMAESGAAATGSASAQPGQSGTDLASSASSAGSNAAVSQAGQGDAASAHTGSTTPVRSGTGAGTATSGGSAASAAPSSIAGSPVTAADSAAAASVPSSPTVAAPAAPSSGTTTTSGGVTGTSAVSGGAAHVPESSASALPASPVAVAQPITATPPVIGPAATGTPVGQALGSGVPAPAPAAQPSHAPGVPTSSSAPATQSGHGASPSSSTATAVPTGSSSSPAVGSGLSSSTATHSAQAGTTPAGATQVGAGSSATHPGTGSKTPGLSGVSPTSSPSVPASATGTATTSPASNGPTSSTTHSPTSAVAPDTPTVVAGVAAASSPSLGGTPTAHDRSWWRERDAQQPAILAQIKSSFEPVIALQSQLDSLIARIREADLPWSPRAEQALRDMLTIEVLNRGDSHALAAAETWVALASDLAPILDRLDGRITDLAATTINPRSGQPTAMSPEAVHRVQDGMASYLLEPLRAHTGDALGPLTPQQRAELVAEISGRLDEPVPAPPDDVINIGQGALVGGTDAEIRRRLIEESVIDHSVAEIDRMVRDIAMDFDEVLTATELRHILAGGASAATHQAGTATAERTGGFETAGADRGGVDTRAVSDLVHAWSEQVRAEAGISVLGATDGSDSTPTTLADLETALDRRMAEIESRAKAEVWFALWRRDQQDNIRDAFVTAMRDQLDNLHLTAPGTPPVDIDAHLARPDADGTEAQITHTTLGRLFEDVTADLLAPIEAINRAAFALPSARIPDLDTPFHNRLADIRANVAHRINTDLVFDVRAEDALRRAGADFADLTKPNAGQQRLTAPVIASLSDSYRLKTATEIHRLYERDGMAGWLAREKNTGNAFAGISPASDTTTVKITDLDHPSGDLPEAGPLVAPGGPVVPQHRPAVSGTDALPERVSVSDAIARERAGKRPAVDPVSTDAAVDVGAAGPGAADTGPARQARRVESPMEGVWRRRNVEWDAVLAADAARREPMGGSNADADPAAVALERRAAWQEFRAAYLWEANARRTLDEVKAAEREGRISNASSSAQGLVDEVADARARHEAAERAVASARKRVVAAGNDPDALLRAWHKSLVREPRLEAGMRPGGELSAVTPPGVNGRPDTSFPDRRSPAEAAESGGLRSRARWVQRDQTHRDQVELEPGGQVQAADSNIIPASTDDTTDLVEPAVSTPPADERAPAQQVPVASGDTVVAPGAVRVGQVVQDARGEQVDRLTLGMPRQTRYLVSDHMPGVIASRGLASSGVSNGLIRVFDSEQWKQWELAGAGTGKIRYEVTVPWHRIKNGKGFSFVAPSDVKYIKVVRARTATEIEVHGERGVVTRQEWSVEVPTDPLDGVVLSPRITAAHGVPGLPADPKTTMGPREAWIVLPDLPPDGDWAAHVRRGRLYPDGKLDSATRPGFVTAYLERPSTAGYHLQVRVPEGAIDPKATFASIKKLSSRLKQHRPFEGTLWLTDMPVPGRRGGSVLDRTELISVERVTDESSQGNRLATIPAGLPFERKPVVTRLAGNVLLLTDRRVGTMLNTAGGPDDHTLRMVVELDREALVVPTSDGSHVRWDAERLAQFVEDNGFLGRMVQLYPMVGNEIPSQFAWRLDEALAKRELARAVARGQTILSDRSWLWSADHTAEWFAPRVRLDESLWAARRPTTPRRTVSTELAEVLDTVVDGVRLTRAVDVHYDIQQFRVADPATGLVFRVRERTLRLHVRLGKGVDHAALGEVRDRLRDVLRHMNAGYRSTDGAVAHFVVDIDASEADAHGVITLKLTGRPNTQEWTVTMTPAEILEEVLHRFGIREEYYDRPGGDVLRREHRVLPVDTGSPATGDPRGSAESPTNTGRRHDDRNRIFPASGAGRSAGVQAVLAPRHLFAIDEIEAGQVLSGGDLILRHGAPERGPINDDRPATRAGFNSIEDDGGSTQESTTAAAGPAEPNVVIPDYLWSGKSVGASKVAIPEEAKNQIREAISNGLGTTESTELIKSRIDEIINALTADFNSLLEEGGREFDVLTGAGSRTSTHVMVRASFTTPAVDTQPAPDIEDPTSTHKDIVEVARTQQRNTSTVPLAVPIVLPGGVTVTVAGRVARTAAAFSAELSHKGSGEVTITSDTDALLITVPATFNVTVGGTTTSVSTDVGVLLPDASRQVVERPHQMVDLAPNAVDTLQMFDADAVTGTGSLLTDVRDALRAEDFQLNRDSAAKLRDFLSPSNIRGVLPEMLKGWVIGPNLVNVNGSAVSAVRMKATLRDKAALVGLREGVKVTLSREAETLLGTKVADSNKVDLSTTLALGLPVGPFTPVGPSVTVAYSRARGKGTAEDVTVTDRRTLAWSGTVATYKVPMTIMVEVLGRPGIGAAATGYLNLPVSDAARLRLPLPDAVKDSLAAAPVVETTNPPPYLRSGQSIGPASVLALSGLDRVRTQISDVLRPAGVLPRFDSTGVEKATASGRAELLAQIENERALNSALSAAAVASRFNALLGPGIEVLLVHHDKSSYAVRVSASLSYMVDLGVRPGLTVRDSTTAAGKWTVTAEGTNELTAAIEIAGTIPKTLPDVSLLPKAALGLRFGGKAEGKLAADITGATVRETSAATVSRAYGYRVDYDVEITRLSPSKIVDSLTAALEGLDEAFNPSSTVIAKTGTVAADHQVLIPVAGEVTVVLPNSLTGQFPGIEAVAEKTNLTPAITVDQLRRDVAQRRPTPFVRMDALVETGALLTTAQDLLNSVVSSASNKILPGTTALNRLAAELAPERLAARFGDLQQRPIEIHFQEQGPVTTRTASLAIAAELRNPRVLAVTDEPSVTTTLTGGSGATGSTKVSAITDLAASASIGTKGSALADRVTLTGTALTKLATTAIGERESKIKGTASRGADTPAGERTVLVQADVVYTLVAEGGAKRQVLGLGAETESGLASAVVTVRGGAFPRITEEQARQAGLLDNLGAVLHDRSQRVDVPLPNAHAPGLLPVSIGVVRSLPDLTPMVRNLADLLRRIDPDLVPARATSDTRKTWDVVQQLASPEFLAKHLEAIFDGGLIVPLGERTLVLSAYRSGESELVELSGVPTKITNSTSVEFSRSDKTTTSTTKEAVATATAQVSTFTVGRGPLNASGMMGATLSRAAEQIDASSVAVTVTTSSSVQGPTAQVQAPVVFQVDVMRGAAHEGSVRAQGVIVTEHPVDSLITAPRPAAPAPAPPATKVFTRRDEAARYLDEWRLGGDVLPPVVSVEAFVGTKALIETAIEAMIAVGAARSETRPGGKAYSLLSAALRPETVRAALPAAWGERGMVLPFASKSVRISGTQAVDMTLYAKLGNPRLVSVSDRVEIKADVRDKTSHDDEAKLTTALTGQVVVNAIETQKFEGQGGTSIATMVPVNGPDLRAKTEWKHSGAGSDTATDTRKGEESGRTVLMEFDLNVAVHAVVDSTKAEPSIPTTPTTPTFPTSPSVPSARRSMDRSSAHGHRRSLSGVSARDLAMAKAQASVTTVELPGALQVRMTEKEAVSFMRGDELPDSVVQALADTREAERAWLAAYQRLRDQIDEIRPLPRETPPSSRRTPDGLEIGSIDEAALGLHNRSLREIEAGWSVAIRRLADSIVDFANRPQAAVAETAAPRPMLDPVVEDGDRSKVLIAEPDVIRNASTALQRVDSSAHFVDVSEDGSRVLVSITVGANLAETVRGVLGGEPGQVVFRGSGQSAAPARDGMTDLGIVAASGDAHLLGVGRSVAAILNAAGTDVAGATPSTFARQLADVDLPGVAAVEVFDHSEPETAAQVDAVARALGVNQYAMPAAGEAFVMVRVGPAVPGPGRTHFIAPVLAVSRDRSRVWVLEIPPTDPTAWRVRELGTAPGVTFHDVYSADPMAFGRPVTDVVTMVATGHQPTLETVVEYDKRSAVAGEVLSSQALVEARLENFRPADAATDDTYLRTALDTARTAEQRRLMERLTEVAGSSSRLDAFARDAARYAVWRADNGLPVPGIEVAGGRGNNPWPPRAALQENNRRSDIETRLTAKLQAELTDRRRPGERAEDVPMPQITHGAPAADATPSSSRRRRRFTVTLMDVSMTDRTSISAEVEFDRGSTTLGDVTGVRPGHVSQTIKGFVAQLQPIVDSVVDLALKRSSEGMSPPAVLVEAPPGNNLNPARARRVGISRAEAVQVYLDTQIRNALAVRAREQEPPAVEVRTSLTSAREDDGSGLPSARLHRRVRVTLVIPYTDGQVTATTEGDATRFMPRPGRRSEAEGANVSG